MADSLGARRKVYLDALSLAPERMSGIGHLTLNLVVGMAASKDFNDKYELQLVLPYNKIDAVKTKLRGAKVSYKRVWLPARALEILNRLGILLPVDLFLGKGFYVFPNFKNWPLTKRSVSFTYIHDVGYMKYPEFVQPKNLAYLRKYMPIWLKRTDYILTISRFSKDEIVSRCGVKSSRIDVVYPGVDAEAFSRRSTYEVEQVKSKYGLIGEDYFLFVGNIEPRKNLERLVDAFNKMPADMKKRYSLVLVGGDGWSNANIYQAIRSAKEGGARIIVPEQYVGDDDLPALYSGAIALIYPPLYEGFGIPLVEAMSCGTPVLAADSGPLPEVTGSAAKLFDPLDIDSIKDAMVYVMKDSQARERGVALGLARAKELSVNNEVLSLISVLDERSKEARK
jgi:glycosyltransferase involved in cell wall biosynthesis